jgi:hypothetical protein
MVTKIQPVADILAELVNEAAAALGRRDGALAPGRAAEAAAS